MDTLTHTQAIWRDKEQLGADIPSVYSSVGGTRSSTAAVNGNMTKHVQN